MHSPGLIGNLCFALAPQPCQALSSSAVVGDGVCTCLDARHVETAPIISTEMVAAPPVCNQGVSGGGGQLPDTLSNFGVISRSLGTPKLCLESPSF